MTNAQYKKVKKLYSKFEGLQGELAGLLERLNSKYDNMSEKTKESERGERLSDTISCLSEAANELIAVMEEVDNSTNGYDEYDEYDD